MTERAQPAAAQTASASSAAAEFAAYYLRRATAEFAEDLDKVRRADDFKNDAVPLLVHALRQGTVLFSPDDQRRIAAAAADGDGEAVEQKDSAATSRD